MIMTAVDWRRRESEKEK